VRIKTKVSSKLIAITASLKRAFSLGPRAWKGAAYLLLLTSVIVWFGSLFSASPSSLQRWLETLCLAVLLYAASLLLGQLIVFLLGQFEKIPRFSRWVLVGTVFLLFMVLRSSVLLFVNVFGLLVLIIGASSLTGAGIGALTEKGLEPVKRRVAVGMLLFGGLILTVMAFWFAWTGPRYQPAEFGGEPADSALSRLDNPAERGSYPVLTLTYGSGADKRPEYGKDVNLSTPTVDLTPLVRIKSGITSRLRKLFWGFDLTEAPLNARVWYPEGEGPFPLVLVVHGNHAMDDFSDPGYAYLGELLASRGWIVASVDQNFLNGGGLAEFILGGLAEENDARGYLLLEHLALWRRWNSTQGHLFENKVDMNKLALIGHSRGGEAAAIAAAFNHLPVYPDNAALRFDFGFDLRAVIAIAPSDGQYKPRRAFTPLENINYLVLHGAADADVYSFAGANQYDRVAFTNGEDYFKAAVYIDGANHGQFNTTWGRVDVPGAKWFLNRGEIMPAEEQEMLAKVLIAGFLDASVNGRKEYEQLFRNPLSGGEWLPTGIYLSQYVSSGIRQIANFEEDLNLKTATLPGTRLEGVNLVTWREEPPTMASKRLRDSMGVRLEWDHEQSGPASYSLQLPAGFTLDAAGSAGLTFAAANVSKEQEPLDFTIMLTDRAGERVELPLSSIMPLPPPLTHRRFKPPLKVSSETEPVYTTYTIHLTAFLAENEAIDPDRLAQISFVFNRSPKGTIFLDDLGFH
jgi:dienelactone hydrolase